MLKKLELQQLQALSLDEVKAYKKKATERKAELEAAKAKGGNDWNGNLQEELDEVVLSLVDVDDVIEEKSSVSKTQANAYVPVPGTEKMVHLLIVRGRKFNPMTGKEESPAYTQMFTFGEWQLFKKTYKGLGYTIIKALHDPYGDATELALKKD